MSGTPHYISTSAQCVFTGLISKQILLLQYLRKAVNMINRFSKNLYVKLLKLYYKEMSTIKSERKLLKKQVESLMIRSQDTNNEIKIISESQEKLWLLAPQVLDKISSLIYH